MIYKNVLGKHILYFDELESTNSTALELKSQEKLEEGSVIVSGYQENGKGLDANKWESEAGKNLCLSFCVCPSYIKPEEQFLLNKVVSLAVADLVKEIIGSQEVQIKWPNDVYVGNKKIAGILITNSIQGDEMSSSIIGIGLNVNQNKFLSDAPNPISLKMITKKKFDLTETLSRLCDYINLRFRGLMRDRDKINKEYLEKLYRFNMLATYIIDNQKIEAKITGLDQYGKLCLQTKDAKKYCCDLKEVSFVI